jgi:hypothetical protein
MLSEWGKEGRRNRERKKRSYGSPDPPTPREVN